MASISKRPNGHREIQFHDGDGKRRTIRLGKVPQRLAESTKVHVENLASAALSGHSPVDETARWVARLDQVMYDRLAAVGLVGRRESLPLEAYLADYFERRTDIKESTRVVLGHTRRELVAFFGPAKPLRDITPGDADDWRRYLIAQGLSVSTVRRRCGIAKQFFRAAVKRRLLPENPFAELKSGDQANDAKDYFVTKEEAAKVLEACPDAQWRLLFAMSRFGGFRCPSEHLSLRWEDVDWERDRMTVHSPKTEHHPGGECRTVPIFPELRPYLEEVWDAAEPGTEYVITRYRSVNQNLRTQLIKIIKRAGLKPWPKLFQNLRATRETELAQRFPLHVVCDWIGHSRLVAQKHYLQVTEDDFKRAAEALQNALQQPHETACNGSQGDLARNEKPPALQGVAASCELMHRNQMGVTGFEPVTSTV